MIDINTITIVSAFSNIILGVLVMLYASLDIADKGIDKVGKGLIIIGLGFVMIIFGMPVNLRLAIFIGNSLFIIGLYELIQGLYNFRDFDNSSKYIDFIILVIYIFIMFYSVFISDNATLRIGSTSLLTIYCFLRITYLISYKNDVILFESKVLNIYFYLAVVMNCIRIYAAIKFGDQNDYIQVKIIQFATLTIDFFMPYNIVLGLFWMSNEKVKIILENSSLTDTLTGLYNRLALYKIAEVRVKNELQKNKMVGVALCDIDYFKRVNDQYGHIAGDTVLKEVADILSDSIRTSDFLARYGGEEFLIVITAVNKEQFEKILQTIKDRIEKNAVPVVDQFCRVTISIGAFTFEDKELSLESAISNADEALYKAKNNGRNRIVFWQ